MPIREEIKSLLALENMTLTELARIATIESKKKVTTKSISEKLSRGTIKFEEARFLAKILGYKVEFRRINK